MPSPSVVTDRVLRTCRRGAAAARKRGLGAVRRGGETAFQTSRLPLSLLLKWTLSEFSYLLIILLKRFLVILGRRGRGGEKPLLFHALVRSLAGSCALTRDAAHGLGAAGDLTLVSRSVILISRSHTFVIGFLCTPPFMGIL